jgi:hypothetical protein
MPLATGVVQEASVPGRPSISTRHSRHEPEASPIGAARPRRRRFQISLFMASSQVFGLKPNGPRSPV